VPKPPPIELTVDGHVVQVTNPDKVMFPERGETKRDLVGYYLAVADAFMREMRDRPTLLQRFPDGATGKSFFQKRVPESRPEWLQTTTMSTPNGTTSEALVLADMAHVVWAVNFGSLGFHPWPIRASQPGCTDELRIDLDPSPGVVFAQVQEAAHETKALFDELGMRSYIKTTGNRGLHIYVRLVAQWDSYSVRLGAIAAARELGRRRPDLITADWWKEERGARVFVDFNQNAPHKTVFGAWCARPRAGAQVSTPFAWDELDAIAPDALTLGVVQERVERDGDPWVTIDDEPQSLAPLLDLWAADRDRGLPDASWPPVYPKMPHEPPRVAPSRAKA